MSKKSSNPQKSTNYKDLSGLGNKTDKELTVEDLKPHHKEHGYPKDVPKWYIRIVEIFPGFFTWTLLLSPFWAALLGYPEIIVYYMAFLTIFWTLRGFRFVYGLAIGYKRMLRDQATDWIQLTKDLPKELPNGLTKKPLKYVLLFPVLKEPAEVFYRSINAWIAQDIGAENITLVFALEKKFADQSIPTAQEIQRRFGDKFADIKIYLHRNDIEGEAQGVKGANINWAARHFVRDLQQAGEHPEDYLLITNDSDYVPHPKYLSAISYKYYTTNKPLQKYYTSAVYKLDNNIWKAPILIRAYSTFLSLALLHAWVIEKKKRDSFSAYVVNLKTLIDIGYWDPVVGIDDTTFYWNSKIHFNGDFNGEEVYLASSNDPIVNKNAYQSYKSLYKQQHRWGAGVISFSIALASLRDKKNKVTRKRKARFFFELFDQYVMYTTVVFLLTFALPIMNWISPEYNYNSASVNLPKIMSVLFMMLMFLNIPISYYRRKLFPIPKDWPWWRKLLDFPEILLVTINMLTFTFIPFIQAQTELLIGKGLKGDYYASERIEHEK